MKEVSWNRKQKALSEVQTPCICLLVSGFFYYIDRYLNILEWFWSWRSLVISPSPKKDGHAGETIARIWTSIAFENLGACWNGLHCKPVIWNYICVWVHVLFEMPQKCLLLEMELLGLITKPL